MMRLIRRLFAKPEIEIPPPRPEKQAERDHRDRLIVEQLEANAINRRQLERSARRHTNRHLASLESAMEILGDRR